MFFYGLAKPQHAVDYAVAVCHVIGHGQTNMAVALLLETMAVETNFASFRDPTERYAGAGATQVDEPTFDWLKKKFKGSKEEKALEHAFGFTLTKVLYMELELSPLLAFVFARLRYLVVKPQIPTTLEGRAKYWKKHYNSSEGEGDVEKYIAKAKNHVPVGLLPDAYAVTY
jgi:hypothetical protein